jgi:hypothetical protein
MEFVNGFFGNQAGAGFNVASLLKFHDITPRTQSFLTKVHALQSTAWAPIADRP